MPSGQLSTLYQKNYYFLIDCLLMLISHLVVADLLI